MHDTRNAERLRFSDRCAREQVTDAPEHDTAPTTEQRFWARVQRGDESSCWPWTGARKVSGYGMVWERDGARRRYVTAHRRAWVLVYGEIPRGLHVLHRCDNPPCCNPGHLFLGSNLDNVRDMVAKERHPRGEHKPTAKLRTVDVTAIKGSLAIGTRQAVLARTYRVSPTTINNIAKGRKWTHVTGTD